MEERDAGRLAALVVRYTLHAFASPLAALQMELDLEDAGAVRRAAESMAGLLQFMRQAVGGKLAAPEEFARLLAAQLVHRPVVVDFAPDASPRSMQAVALLLPVLAGALGGRGEARGAATRAGFEVQIAGPQLPSGAALLAVLGGAVPADSALAPAALAVALVGPLTLTEEATPAGRVAVVRKSLAGASMDGAS